MDGDVRSGDRGDFAIPSVDEPRFTYRWRRRSEDIAELLVAAKATAGRATFYLGRRGRRSGGDTDGVHAQTLRFDNGWVVEVVSNAHLADDRHLSAEAIAWGAWLGRADASNPNHFRFYENPVSFRAVAQDIASTSGEAYGLSPAEPTEFSPLELADALLWTDR